MLWELMMNEKQASRPAAVYVLTGLMLVIAVIFGGFFLVWCGTLRFIASGSGWRAFVVLLFPGFIAWRAFEAARDAWEGSPSAPPAAIVTVLLVQLLVGLAQADAYFSGDLDGIGLFTILPHALFFGLIALVFWLSSRFDEHRFETEVEYEPEAAAPNDDDDDDLLYLGGA